VTVRHVGTTLLGLALLAQVYLGVIPITVGLASPASTIWGGPRRYTGVIPLSLVTTSPVAFLSGVPILPPPPWTIPDEGGHGTVMVVRRRRRWR
jgi:hypothetical protein